MMNKVVTDERRTKFYRIVETEATVRKNAQLRVQPIRRTSNDMWRDIGQTQLIHERFIKETNEVMAKNTGSKKGKTKKSGAEKSNAVQKAMAGQKAAKAKAEKKEPIKFTKLPSTYTGAASRNKGATVVMVHDVKDGMTACGKDITDSSREGWGWVATTAKPGCLRCLNAASKKPKAAAKGKPATKAAPKAKSAKGASPKAASKSAAARSK